MPASALQNPPSTTALTDNWVASSRSGYMAGSAALTEPREHSFSISSGDSAYRVVLRNTSLPAWVEPTISAFVGIQKLRDNWNSYGGKPVNNDLIKQSLFVLGLIMQANSPAPSVVPIGDGGIQLEWHRRQQDLEIVFPADEVPQFYYRNRAAGLKQEGFANETAALTQLLGNLA
jgi:hypothetical protein